MARLCFAYGYDENNIQHTSRGAVQIAPSGGIVNRYSRTCKEEAGDTRVDTLRVSSIAGAPAGCCERSNCMWWKPVLMKLRRHTWPGVELRGQHTQVVPQSIPSQGRQFTIQHASVRALALLRCLLNTKVTP